MLLSNGITLISGIFAGLSLLSVGAPLVGEMVATMAPHFGKDEDQAIQSLGLEFENVAFPTTNGLTLRGWYFPADRNNAPAILYAPATAQDQRSGVSLVKPFHNAGYNVLLFSYRGHGSSDGNRFGFTYGANESEDVDAAVRYLYENRGISNIGAIGHSAGAVSIILSAARNQRIKAVVAASPYSSVDEVWETSRPKIFPRPLFEIIMELSEERKYFDRDDVRPMDVISQISPRPLMLIHGDLDERITQEQAINLYRVANAPKEFWLIKGADHAGVRTPTLDDLVPKIISFFDSAFEKEQAFK